MTTRTIERLLEIANASPDGDTSLNLARRRFLAETDCIEFFVLTRDRLSQIDEWNKNSGVTDYALFNDAGEKDDVGVIDEGRFIRIGLYGSGKYDWVRVISIVDEAEEFVITVKPSHDPTQQPVDPTSISHFFGPEATNNFCLQRHDKTVTLYVIGIDEKQNTRFTDGLIESARNVAVANVGYYSGLQKAVWKSFCSNFLESEEEKDD